MKNVIELTSLLSFEITLLEIMACDIHMIRIDFYMHLWLRMWNNFLRTVQLLAKFQK